MTSGQDQRELTANDSPQRSCDLIPTEHACGHLRTKKKTNVLHHKKLFGTLSDHVGQHGFELTFGIHAAQEHTGCFKAEDGTPV